MAHYQADDTLEFLGRAEDQSVEIQHRRIRLAEIEAAIRQYPLVHEAAVQLQADSNPAASADKGLVAYIVPTSAVSSESFLGDLRQFLKERMPQSMLPVAFILLDALPRTANGNVDRRALAAGRSSQPAPQDAQASGGDHDLSTRRAQLSERQARLSTEKRARLAQVRRDLLDRRAQATALPQAVTIGKRPASSQAPLSFAQQRMWFLAQLTPDSAANVIAKAIRLQGQLNRPALEHSLSEIVRRHGSLRTTFATVNGQPTPTIRPATPLQMPLVSLEVWPANEREAQARRLATEEAQHYFDLAEGPLVRFTLLRLDDQDHILLLTMHHIVSDGWSMGVFTNELEELYTAAATGRPAVLPGLVIQYSDFAYWQRDWLQGEVLQAQLDYWKQQLGGSLPILELPTDRPRPPTQTFQGAMHSVLFPLSLAEALKNLGQSDGATLFMTLLAAFDVWLYRYTGQADLLVGTPIANRTRTETENLIGFFVNTLVLRTDLAGNPSFRELVARIRQVTLGAYAHQDLPFERLVAELHPQRDLGHTPLFQVMFALYNPPAKNLSLPDLQLTNFEFDTGTSQFDLNVFALDLEYGLSLSWQYNTDLFDAATIARMAEHFQTLLTGIVAHPEQPIAELPLLTDAERRQLLIEWNDTCAEIETRCVHEWFQVQVERTPGAVAIVFEDQALTYAEFGERANQLAHYLQAHGVGPDTLVGICMERSLEMVVAIYGILKAGGAYVPLDPTYPPERLSFMLQDARTPLVLTQARLSKPGLSTADWLCLDSDWRLIAAYSPANPAPSTTSQNAAYMIYTSGSTGQPKGVINTHGGLSNRLRWMQTAYALTPADRVLQKTPFSFDVSVWEFFWPLLFGAQLIVARPEGHKDSAYLVELIARQGITTLHFVPSMLQVFLEEPGLESCTGLKQVICSGEAMPFDLQERFFAHLQAELHNLYGPTEAAIDVTAWACRAGDPQRTVPIGRPIANTQIYLLNEHLDPVPLGVPGELHIGGAGLARGYLRRPELTAARFIPDPFSPTPGARLYQTGDLARSRPDSCIEFLGRLDFQVKLRGFRIETGEIESALNQHPAVGTSVVLARQDRPCEKRLVAYIVPVHRPAPTTSLLHQFLKDKLPDYMVPSAFVVLDALPLTPSGKVDRRALPAPEGDRPELASAFVAPRTPVEQVLAGIWAQVLGLERVGVYDNFFELGGDSILSIQVVARAHQAGLQFAPQQIFQYQTIAELAAMSETAPAIQAEQSQVTGPVPLTPVQHWFFERELADPHHFNQSVLLKANQPLVPSRLHQAVQSLLAHHDALRLRFTRQASHLQQVNTALSPAVPFTCIDLSTLPAPEQIAAMEAASARLQASLSLCEGPLLRVANYDLGVHKPALLLITIHHLAVDGVSWRILLEDLSTAYQQLGRADLQAVDMEDSRSRAAGNMPGVHLPPKTTSFKQWAERLTEYAQSPDLRPDLDYWLEQSQIEIASLPTDYPWREDANTEASAHSVTVCLSAQETHSVLQEIPSVYGTQINDILLTALAQALAGWTGSRVSLIDLEGHGREAIFQDIDLSRTVGWFTTIFPVRLDLRKTIHPKDALKAIKEQLRHIPGRGLSYGLLRYLSADADVTARMRSLPRPQVVFNYLGQFDQIISESTLFTSTRGPMEPMRSPRNQTSHLIEIDSSIVQGQLQVVWTYSENIHQHTTIERLAQSFIVALQALIQQCQSPDAGGYTPSDFPEAGLGQRELDELIEQLGSRK